MLDFRVAQEMLRSFAGSFGHERIPLAQVQGRVLAESIFADRDYPPFNRATMDGFALRLDELQTGKREFVVAETIFAGQMPLKKLVSGSCYKIMTGAAVPAEADIVIRREDALLRDDTVTILTNDHKRFTNISRKGEDTKSGQVVISTAITCRPAVISVLAALGQKLVQVERLPTVSLFTTGNEIRSIEESVNDYQIRNSNRFLLEAMLKIWGITPARTEHIPDDKVLLEKQFTGALDSDIIIVSGAVSAGDADFVPEVMEKVGVEKIFHQLSIRPGKPIWCGRHKNGCMVFALPGNPFSSLVTFVWVVEYYLGMCLNSDRRRTVMMPLVGTRKKKSTLDEFFPVRVERNPVAAMPLSFNSSGDVLAAMYADGIAHHPAAVEQLVDGDKVEVSMMDQK